MQVVVVLWFNGYGKTHENRVSNPLSGLSSPSSGSSQSFEVILLFSFTG